MVFRLYFWLKNVYIFYVFSFIYNIILHSLRNTLISCTQVLHLGVIKSLTTYSIKRWSVDKCHRFWSCMQVSRARESPLDFIAPYFWSPRTKNCTPVSNWEFNISGENLVPKPKSQSETSPRSRTGKAEDGVAVPSSPPPPLSPSRSPRVLFRRRPPLGVVAGGPTPHGSDWPHSAGAANSSHLTARYNAITKSAHVLGT